MKLSISTDVLRLVAPCVSKEETRYYLQGVWIEPAETGVLAVAMDGHRAAIFYDPEGSIDRGAIIALDFKAAVLSPKRGVERRLTVDLPEKPFGKGVPGEISACDEIVGSTLVYEIDGTFPVWRKIVPQNLSLVASWDAGFSPVYIAEIASTFAKVTRHGTAMTIRQADPNGPAVIRMGDYAGGFYVLMPMRTSDVSKNPLPIPASILRLPEPEPEAA